MELLAPSSLSKGMLKDTLIVYTADNGGPIKQAIPGNTDAIGASNYPLRGGKHNAYEGGVRSTAWLSGGPLDAAIVAAGGVAPSTSPGQDYYWGLMHAVDWVPTLANVAGYAATPKTAGIVLDGIDHWHAIITNTTSPRTSIILDIESPHPVIPRWGDVGAGVVRNGSYKLHIGDAGQLVRSVTTLSTPMPTHSHPHPHTRPHARTHTHTHAHTYVAATDRRRSRTSM